MSQPHVGFGILQQAKQDLIDWSALGDHPIYRIEHVATFEEWDDTTVVWVFYETDANLGAAAGEGANPELEQRYRSILEGLDFPFREFPQLRFRYDSHENVVANYEGKYFYRLR